MLPEVDVGAGVGVEVGLFVPLPGANLGLVLMAWALVWMRASAEVLLVLQMEGP